MAVYCTGNLYLYWNLEKQCIWFSWLYLIPKCVFAPNPATDHTSKNKTKGTNGHVQCVCEYCYEAWTLVTLNNIPVQYSPFFFHTRSTGWDVQDLRPQSRPIYQIYTCRCEFTHKPQEHVQGKLQQHQYHHQRYDDNSSDFTIWKSKFYLSSHLKVMKQGQW